MSQTLKKITFDILEIVRSGSVSKSETISLRQIEEWIHQYRAKLIIDSYEKNYNVSQSLIQSLNCLELVQVDKAECCNTTSCTVLKSAIQLPKFVRTKTGWDLLTFVGTIEGKAFQLTTEQGAYWRQFRKFTNNDIYAYLKNNYIYIVGTGTLEKITIRGVFENPTDIVSFTNGCTGLPCYDIDDEYPINRDMLPALKGLILKQELGIMLASPSDKDNDASNVQTPNTSKT